MRLDLLLAQKKACFHEIDVCLTDRQSIYRQDIMKKALTEELIMLCEQKREHSQIQP